MANQHITAAFRCSQFKGNARLVLLYLADAASTGPTEDKRKILPLGYCKRKLTTIMAAVGCHRQQTVTAALTELKDAGAIKQWLKKGASPLYFVDLEWLKAHAYTDRELDSFTYPSLELSRKAANLENASGMPAAYQRFDAEQRKATNLDNGKRLTLDNGFRSADQRPPSLSAKRLSSRK